MLELANGEINCYQLNRVNKWTPKEILEFIKIKENMNQKELFRMFKNDIRI